MTETGTGNDPPPAWTSEPGLPRAVRAALEEPPVPPRSWREGIGPALLAVGLSVVFLDRLPATTLMRGGLAPSIVGLVLGGLLAYWCLYYAPAMWGVRTRRPLAVVATSTFGMSGAVAVPGLLLGVVSVLWFAVTIDYATQYGLAGLASCGFVDAGSLATRPRGPFAVPTPLFLFVAASWSLASAVIGTLAIRLVLAVMAAYIVFPALTIAAATAWAIPTVGSGPIETLALAPGRPTSIGALVLALWPTIGNTIQIVFAYLAAHGLASADWGAASRTERDVREGGMVGLMAGVPVLAVLSLLIVAGALGRDTERRREMMPGAGASRRPSILTTAPGGAPTPAPAARPSPTLREAFARGIGGRLGGAGLLVLALGLLGPACSSPFAIARRFHAAFPSLPRWAWSMAGAVATWPLIASGFTRRPEAVFSLIGALTAPAVGAIAADFARSRGVWPGPARGVHPVGIAAWLAGASVALALWLGGDRAGIAGTVPSSVAGFGVAFALFGAFGFLGSNRRMGMGPVSAPGSDLPGA